MKILRTLIGCFIWLLAGLDTAEAVVLNARGEGQLLIFPYYSTAAGNSTLLTLTNYRQQPKVLRVRIAEGENAQDAGSFHVYMAPYDVWTGVLFDRGDGATPGLATSDESCTVPALRESASLPQLPGGLRYLPLQGGLADAGSRDPARLREGFVEVLEVASIRQPSVSARAVTPRNGQPRDCAVLQAAWEAPGGYWRADPLKDLANPAGGIGGEIAIVNVAAGTVFGIAPVAIDDFRVDPADQPRGSSSSVALHARLSSREPPLSTLALTDPARGIASADVLADGQPRRLSYPAPQRAADAVSAVLMLGRAGAVFEQDAAIGSRTSYVLTYPTRPLYTDQQYIGQATGIAPFPARFQGRVPLDRALGMRFNLLNRESSIVALGGPPDDGCGFVCPPPLQARLPGTAVEVLAPGGTPDPQLGTRLHADIGYGANSLPTATNGWLQLHADRFGGQRNQLRPSLEGYSLRGLPLIGTRVITYVNEDIGDGVRANYSTALPMSGYTQCVDAQMQPCGP